MKAVFLDRATIDTSISLEAIKAQVSELVEYDLTSSREIFEKVENADIIITNKVVIDSALMEKLPNLKLICITATGMNNVDLVAAKKHNIVVKNVSGYSTHSVTQHVFTYLLNAVSNVPSYLKNNTDKPWQQSPKFCQIDFPINELNGKKLGILGYGNLGKSVAQVALAFGMDVLISERPREKSIREGRISFESMLQQSDVISLHCPLTEDNYGLFDKNIFAQMNRGCIFINTARGPIVNSNALAEALKSGQVAHAIVDVLEQEPPPNDHPLLQTDVPNLSMTHHIAWGSLQAQEVLIDGVVANIGNFIENYRLEQKARIVKSLDAHRNSVKIGDKIKVVSIDERILEHLPEDELKDLKSFIGEVFVVEDINSDGSMVVTKSWQIEDEQHIMGHSVAIFPEGALLQS
ncbi:MAG: D-2-hydroxyacid dehydrogenase [Kangiellaceae bacterium]|nr:D-2-hydroxyacid dehydrogenase [Kangiellaceae bacterium]MCW8999819.1 D-2-hydroxyacid dehydrogenase [Kangiellaceae bacterium]